MKALILSFVLAVAVMTPALSLGDTLEALHQSFITRYDEANSLRDEQLRKLDASYLGALERQLEHTKAGGRLEAVLPIIDEIDAVKTAKQPLPTLPDTAIPELKQMRRKHADGRDKILKSHAETLTSLASKMEKALKLQESELTKTGKIEAALAAKHMRDSLAKDQGIQDAQDLIKNAGLPGSTRPALRLRRYGDNLEVLVMYDRSGKVSMESPVKNVIEQTGEKKDKGDTKAKVLGEFVGAKGFEVDSFVSLHQVFDGKDAGKFTMAEMVSGFRHEVKQQTGMRLSLKAKAKNPVGGFGPVLPPISSSGTYRIVTNYFIPENNRALTGFILVQGVGGPIGARKFEESGKWTTGEITSSSLQENGTLLFYLSMAIGKTAVDAETEFIVLGDIKVEHLKFSAFLQQKSDPDGRLSEIINDPLKQSVFISNGEFVQK